MFFFSTLPFLTFPWVFEQISLVFSVENTSGPVRLSAHAFAPPPPFLRRVRLLCRCPTAGLYPFMDGVPWQAVSFFTFSRRFSLAKSSPPFFLLLFLTSHLPEVMIPSASEILVFSRFRECSISSASKKSHPLHLHQRESSSPLSFPLSDLFFFRQRFSSAKFAMKAAPFLSSFAGQTGRARF